MRLQRVLAAAFLTAAVAAVDACSGGSRDVKGVGEIQHVIVIMQENRSFDTYFGTFPGADGLPRRHGVFTVCMPDPQLHACQRPFHDTADRSVGGAHAQPDAVADIAGGRMDGFLADFRRVKLSVHSVEHLQLVAAELNARPRKTLGWRTPAAVLADLQNPPGTEADRNPGTLPAPTEPAPPCLCDSD